MAIRFPQLHGTLILTHALASLKIEDVQRSDARYVKGHYRTMIGHSQIIDDIGWYAVPPRETSNS
ncbi:hypothetical protein DPMN_126327 [Dreissena polymorpha]|uniref:Uncharacterized protein n=1 Tax=Dreissena polymorpha TaxID=45954 RepID=A0A9D4GZB4_DREPO|nr:hypothetical protein DPMN_126327 [Dreissena polymorpha]